MVVLLWIASSPPAVFPGEFYSWIDASGTMVITDDAGRIPPPTQRSPIAVHRFGGIATTSSKPTGHLLGTPGTAPTPSVEGSSEIQKVAQEQKAATQANSTNRADLDLPQILLDAPDQTAKTQYDWVPLLAPIYVGPSPVSGFWCRRDVQSPLDAFKQFLRQQHRQLQNAQAVAGGGQWQGIGALNGPPSSTSPVSTSGNPVYDQVLRERQTLNERVTSLTSGNYVYDQVLRERQALNERIASQFQPAPQTSSQCCPKGSSRAGSGPSGSKQ